MGNCPWDAAARGRIREGTQRCSQQTRSAKNCHRGIITPFRGDQVPELTLQLAAMRSPALVVGLLMGLAGGCLGEIIFGGFDIYPAWATDLKPGYAIEQIMVDGDFCFCKVPNDTTTTTTTSPDSTTTTTTTSTTTTSSGGTAGSCGTAQCNKNITINSNPPYPWVQESEDNWYTPYWPGDYKDGCHCTLFIKCETMCDVLLHIDGTLWDDGTCSDRAHVYSSDGKFDEYLCNDFEEFYYFDHWDDEEAYIAVKFDSDDSDGLALGGFKVNVEYWRNG